MSSATAATDGWTTSSGSPCGRPRARVATDVLTGQDKGQRAQLERFVDAVRTGSADADPAGVSGRDDARDACRGTAVCRQEGRLTW